jgi:hypothetical protein
MRGDLHIHTYYSDGLQSPEDVAVAAKRLGLDVVAVTDHDSMLGTDEAKAACKRVNIIAVDGIEISAYDNGVKVHMLGYNVDNKCERFKTYFAKAVANAEERAKDILSKLKRHGVNLTLEEVLRERKSKFAPIHAMHISRAAARKGYASSPADFYLSYLNAGKCAYSSVGRVTPKEALETIHACGGICSLTHPGRISLDTDKKLELIESLCGYGLDGIEAVYSGHTESDTAYFKEIAAKYNLLITGGSDTHYQGGNREIGQPEFKLSESLLSALKII